MRGFICLCILFLVILSLSVTSFALPTAPPFEILDMNANSDAVETVEEIESVYSEVTKNVR